MKDRRTCLFLRIEEIIELKVSVLLVRSDNQELQSDEECCSYANKGAN